MSGVGGSGGGGEAGGSGGAGVASGARAVGGVRGLDARLALPAAVAWVTTIVLVGAPSWAGWVGGAAAVLAAAGLIASSRRVGRARAVVAVEASIPSIIAVAVLAASVALLAPAREPPVVADALDRGDLLEVAVALDETVVPGTTSADATIVRARDRDGDTADVQVPVRLLGLDLEERAPLGSRWEGRVTLIALDPGDDRVALARPVAGLVPVERPPPLIDGADALRERFLGVASALPGQGAALLPGLAIGDTSAVGAELDEAMKRSSLSHLTAVSGANCAIVVGLVLGLGALLRWPRAVRVGAALAALGGFVVLVTPQASVVRAAVMAAVVLLALSSGRPARGLPVLGVAVLGILVLDPWTARDYGFALSVLATAALLLLAGPLAERLGQVMPRVVALWLGVPLAAQLACQPVLVLLAPELPLAGVAANVLAAPAAPVATIVGMAACLAAPVLPWLATALAAVAWVPATWIAGIAHVASGLPSSSVPWPEGGMGALLLAGLTAGALAAAGIPYQLPSARARRAVALTTGGALMIVVGASAGAAALRSLGQPSDWVVAQCDVGQGDAIVVRSRGFVALTDTGVDPEPLAECLDALGIERIDLLVLTHFDADHVGGVSAVIGRVDTVVTGPTDGERDELLLAELEGGGARVVPVTAGATGSLGDYGWRALWPPDHRGVEPGNDASVVVEWRANGCACPSMLALGDLGRGAQESLRASVRLAPVDIVKVSHHGSNDQDPQVYDDAAAALGLIGVGADNTYGHPTAEALDMVGGAGGAALRSDEHGLVLIGPADDGGWRVWTARGGLP